MLPTMVIRLQRTDKKLLQEIQDPNSDVRFIIGTPQTGGYGITLN